MPAAIWVPALISSAAAVGGSAIAAHGNTSAAKTNAEASDKAAQLQYQSNQDALNQAREIYNRDVAAQQPYTRSGYGSLNALNFGLGLPAVDIPPPVQPLGPASSSSSDLSPIVAPGAKDAHGNPMPGAGNGPAVTPPTMAQQMTGSNAAQTIVNQGNSGSDTQRVKAPNGQVYLIPSTQVSAALQAGGQVVS